MCFWGTASSGATSSATRTTSFLREHSDDRVCMRCYDRRDLRRRLCGVWLEHKRRVECPSNAIPTSSPPVASAFAFYSTISATIKLASCIGTATFSKFQTAATASACLCTATDAVSRLPTAATCIGTATFSKFHTAATASACLCTATDAVARLPAATCLCTAASSCLYFATAVPDSSAFKRAHVIHHRDLHAMGI